MTQRITHFCPPPPPPPGIRLYTRPMKYLHPSQLLPWWSTLQLPCCALEEIVMPTVNGGASAISRSITEIWLSMHRPKTGRASTLAGALPAISCNALHISTAPTRHIRTSANFIVKLKGHGHGSESPHTPSISLMRCILKTGLVVKIRGGIPISAARASVGGVWPWAKCCCCIVSASLVHRPLFGLRALRESPVIHLRHLRYNVIVV